MAQRLFNGSIQPQARPLNAFVQPGQSNIAGPTQQSQVQIGRGIVTQQQAGTSSVAGFNQWEQLTSALKPFSKQLDGAVKKGFRQYAINNIEDGYYDELKNEQLRAKLQMQQNQEAGAADAAETITALGKVDPIGATLAKEANPWKLIGRKRALAQLAAGEVSARFNAELAQNAGMLATMAPGSPELMQRKAELTQGVLSDFGLSGDELESSYYVSPQINKSWDKFTQKQSELYSAEVYRSSTALTGAAVKTALSSLLTEGVLLQTGERVMPGDPRFGNYAGIKLTQEIDKGVSLLGGDDKTKALQSIRENLGLLYNSNTPGATTAIDNIRLGSVNLPMDKRPRWIDANPFELQDYSNKALTLRSDAYEAQQQSIKDSAEQRWNQTMSGLQVDSPEYQDELKLREAELEAENYRDTAGFIRDRIADDRAVAEGNGGANPMSFEEKALFEEALNNLTPGDVQSVDMMNTVNSLARQAAMREPTEELREKAYKEYIGIINKKREQFAGLPKNSAMRSAINNQVKEDLADPSIAGLKGATGFQNGTYFNRNGAAPTQSEQRYRAFGNTVNRLHTQEYMKRLNEWRGKNPGMRVDPGTEAQIISDSAEAVRKSEAFKKAKDKALQQGESTPPPQVNQDPKTGPVPKAAASSVTPEQASSYVDKPVMNARWVRSELSSIRGGTVAGSTELKGLAKAAGVKPHRYLLEQLKFYGPTLDPTGAYRGWLEKSLQQQKTNSTPAATYGDQSSTSRSPGAWLNQLVMPVEISRLPGGEQGPAQGPYTPVQRIPGMGWGPDGREPAPNFQTPIPQA
jgi:hypothetical protein